MEERKRFFKALGLKSCAIIRTPDYDGGWTDRLHFSCNENEDWWEGLEPFHYVEWNGSIDELYKQWPEMTFHREPFHEEPVDGEISLLDEINSYLEDYNDGVKS